MKEDQDEEGREPTRDENLNPFEPVPKDHEPWLNEGGTARYPEGTKIRGHDINALLDDIRGKERESAEDSTSKRDE